MEPTEESPRVLRSLRQMAWERAKGEINAMLCTFWSSTYRGEDAKAEGLSAAFERFVSEVEDNGYQE